MQNKKTFDGGGWYSARPAFGEKVIMVKIDAGAVGIRFKKFRVDAISMWFFDDKSPKP